MAVCRPQILLFWRKFFDQKIFTQFFNSRQNLSLTLPSLATTSLKMQQSTETRISTL